MKLGIAMLVIGLVIAGLGFGLWQFYSMEMALKEYAAASLLHARYVATAKGATVFGGGLSIGGIVKMIVKR